MYPLCRGKALKGILWCDAAVIMWCHFYICCNFMFIGYFYWTTSSYLHRKYILYPGQLTSTLLIQLHIRKPLIRGAPTPLFSRLLLQIYNAVITSCVFKSWFIVIVIYICCWWQPVCGGFYLLLFVPVFFLMLSVLSVVCRSFAIVWPRTVRLFTHLLQIPSTMFREHSDLSCMQANFPV